MLEWCMTHPWLTFFLGFGLLLVIEDMIQGVCKIIISCIEKKHNKKESNNNA